MTNLITILLLTNTVESFEPIIGPVPCPDRGSYPSYISCAVAHRGKVGENKEIKLLTTTVSKKTSTVVQGIPFEKIELLTNWVVRYKKVESWVVDTNGPTERVWFSTNSTFSLSGQASAGTTLTIPLTNWSAR